MVSYTVCVKSFREATDYLFGLVDYERAPAGVAAGCYLNLDRMRDALARAGNPHAGLRCVHIAGTKGKGSTAAMVAAIARAAGRRVGLFTSPHLITFRERIRIDDALIPEAAFTALVEELRAVIEPMRTSADGAPTFFEACTLLAFCWFARQQVELAVLETGMGGRLDATNVVTPLVTGLTTIALDHQTELGDTLVLIAAEKAGIIKPGVPVVSAPQEPDAAEVIACVAATHGSPHYRVGAEIRLLPATSGAWDFTVAGRLDRYVDLFCPLLGAHQQRNAAVAIGLAECLREAGEPITPAAIRAGIAGVTWPGRLQTLRERPLLLVDGAHDPASIAALLAALDRHYPGRPRIFILGFSREKDWPQMLRQLAPTTRACLLTAAATSRATAPSLLAAEAQALGIPHTLAPDVAAAIAQALTHAGPDDLICVTGSLYAVGDALKWAARETSDRADSTSSKGQL